MPAGGHAAGAGPQGARVAPSILEGAQPRSAWSRRLYDYDWNEVERIWRTVGNRPDVPNAVFFAVDYLAVRRRYTELVQWLQRALQHDPLNGLIRVILGSFLLGETQYDQTLDEMRTVLNVNDDVFSRSSAHYVMAMVYSRMKQPAEALAAAERAYESAPWHRRLIGMFASALARAGSTAAPTKSSHNCGTRQPPGVLRVGWFTWGWLSTIWS